MENYELKPIVSSILQFLEDTTGCYLKDLEGQTSFEGSIGRYCNTKDLFTINNYIQSGDYEIAYEKEITFLKNLISEIRFSHRMDELVQDCEAVGNALLKAHHIFKEYVAWAAEEKIRFREYLFNNEFLKEEFDVRFIQKKPKALEWLYLLIFGTGLLIAVPFVALAIISEIIFYAGKAWIQWLSNILDIEFTL